MRIAIIIPDRGDRPELLANCHRMMDNQTLKPEIICTISQPPKSELCDITWRYRIGYNHLDGKDIDLIAFIENDDYYAPDYLEYMVKEWEKAGKPDLFGTNYTIYYHIKVLGYFSMDHDERASAMNTFIKPRLKFDWCPDHEPFTDVHLWMNCVHLSKVVIQPDKIRSIGIKHGMSMTGGRSHVDKLERYNENRDLNLEWLRSNTDSESFEFYKRLNKHLNENFNHPSFPATPSDII